MNRRSPHASALRTRKRLQLRDSAQTAIRDAILVAAEKVFAGRGFDAAKITEVAREAGVAAGTLYNYFDSKDQIIESIVARRGEEIVARLEAAYAEVDDPLLRLTVITRVSLEYIEEHRAMFLVFAQVNGLDFGMGQSGEAVATYHRCTAIWERAVRDAVAKKLFRKDLAVEHQVALITGAIHGVIRAWFMSGGSAPLARKTPMLIQFIVGGLGAR